MTGTPISLSGAVLSAQFANEENTAIIIQTEYLGGILLSETDSPIHEPELWEAFQTWKSAGGSVTPYVDTFTPSIQ